MGWAVTSLSFLGEAAIPVLQNAIADSNRVDRSLVIFWALPQLMRDGHTNACLPILLAAQQDQDPFVRNTAAKILRDFVPQLLTNGIAE